MLGNEGLSVRLGGIYALSRLAREHPGDYHTQIMRLLCAFVRNPLEAGKEAQATNKLNEDVLVIVSGVRVRSEAQIKIEKKEKYHLGLSRTDLCGVYLSKANLSYAYLVETNLNRAILVEANLIGARLMGADLSMTHLTGADLSDADLRKCKNLTQEQVDRAIVQQDHLPPDLTGVVDANTGKPLVWRGGTPNG